MYLACFSALSDKRCHINKSLYTPSFSMLFLLFLYHLLQDVSIAAGPIPIIEDRSLAENRCTDLTHCRTIWGIVWSCLVTIFSCTWVAVHPNIPCPKKREADGWIQRCIYNPLLSFAEHRFPLFVCALLVPEYVLAWAIRQYLRARDMASVNKGELDTLNKILDILIHSYIKDAPGHMRSLLSWEVFISSSALRKKRVITPNISLISRKTMTFRFIHSLFAISITTQPSTSTSPRLRYRQRRKSRTRERATGSLNPLSYSKHRGS